jgi:hypothetical protein
MPQPVSYNPGTPVSGSIQENNISYVVDGQQRDYRGGFGGLSWMSEVPAENNVIFIGNTTSIGKGPAGKPLFYPSYNNSSANIVYAANTLPGSPRNFTTTASAYNWAVTNNFFINNSDNPIPRIDADGMVLYLDARQASSYPQTGSIWYDVSGYNNSGSLTNGPIFNTNGAIMFDGVDDFVSVATNTILNLTQTGGAVGVWFKTSTPATGSLKGNLVAKTDTYVEGYWLTKYNSTLRMSLFGASGGGFIEMIGNKNIVDNRWHYTIATWNSSQLSLYIDGLLDKTESYNFAFTTTPIRPLYIGRQNNAGELFFSGSIAIVQVYNKTLSQAEILQNYYQAPIVTNGLVMAVDADNLVSYESGSLIVYSMTGSYSGSLINGTGFTNSNGGAWNFDGVDDYIQMNNNASINSIYTNNQLTISSWFKYNDSGSFRNVMGILKNGDPTFLAFGWRIGDAGSFFFDSNINNTRITQQLIADISSYAGNYINATTTYTNGSLLSYINGVLVNSSNITGPIVDFTSNDFLIGASAGYSVFKGNIAPTFLYNRALSASEVQQNYQATKDKFQGQQIITQGITLYLDSANKDSYPGTGTTWYDLSGNGNNGTLVNGPSFLPNVNSGIFDFDGVDDYTSLGFSAASLIQGKTAVTIGIFFKLDVLADLRGLIGTLNYGCGANLGLVARGNVLTFYNDTGTCYDVGISSFVETGKWIYAVGTYDGTTTRIYGIKDGILSQDSGTGKSGATNTFTSDFRIIGNQYPDYFTNGQCGTAFVYNRVLSQAEILQNYNATKGRFGL